jgi:hypothetical protein
MWRVAPSYDEVSDMRRDALGNPLRAMFTAAQAENQIRTDIIPDGLSVAWIGLITAVLPPLAEKTVTHDEAVWFVMRMLSA